MVHRTVTYGRMFCLAALSLVLFSCSNTTTVIPAAANIFAGTADGTAFTAELVTATKDTSGLVTISGNIQSDALFSFYFFDGAPGDYPVSISGVLAQLIETLDSIATLDPETQDTIITILATEFNELVESGAPILNEFECFGFFILNDFLYYTKTGFLSISARDEDLRRINGTLDVEWINLLGGRKNMTATFEDIEYFER